EVADQPLSVDDAFGSIFGEDELPEEKPVESAPGDDFNFTDDSLSLESPAEAVAAAETEASQSAEDVLDLDIPAGEWKVEPEQTFVPEVEVPSDPVIASPMDFVNDESEVGNAFSSIFGDDDDLPEEKPVAAAEEPAFEMPAVEESLSSEATLAEQVNLAESELEMPAVEPKQEPSDIAQEMGGAFASMFGDDDDLDLPDTKSEPVESSEAPQATTAAFEEAAPVEENLSSDLDKSFDSLFGSDDDLNLPSDEKPVAGNPDLASLETEVSGAFKGLFDMEDDSLTEESKPSNSGVDFLMSGDSDDEISAGLIKNPDAPLDRGVHNLEDSMGTRTLAEIYFDQGLYGDALKVYQELLQRDPSNEEFAARKSEIEKICRDKFGGNA
ncbi:MAG: hypothetical protein MJY98_07095, partial [Fibrobacter sp.]|nr:hypothetical protein [Fibrobacter sp.]